LGGALYLDHPQSMLIQDSTFTKLKALNRTSDKLTDQPSGIAGAIYYECSVNDRDCSMSINGDTLFTSNYASIKGGAIHWNFYEPNFGPNVKFIGNKAGWYGDSISSYS
jgi:hypothetical protein